MDNLISLINEQLIILKKDIIETIRVLYDLKEIGYKEFKSVNFLSQKLKKYGYSTECGIGNIPTAFLSRSLNGNNDVNLGLIAEYDALPEIGHGCGHNLISAVMLGVFLILNALKRHWTGSLTLFGTPAEEGCVENAGSKVLLLKHHIFADIDVMIATHPGSYDIVGCNAINRYALQVTFSGNGGHYAFCKDSENTISPLITFLNFINEQKQYLKSRNTTIQYITSDCGTVPNIMPKNTSCKLYIRSVSKTDLNDILNMLKSKLDSIVNETSVSYHMKEIANFYRDFFYIHSVHEIFKKHFDKLSHNVKYVKFPGNGASDIGNVSQHIVTCHSFFSVCTPDIYAHTHKFAQNTVSDDALAGVLKMIKVICLFCINCFNNPDLVTSFKKEFVRRHSKD